MGRHASVVNVYGADLSRSDALRLSDAMAERLRQIGVDDDRIESDADGDLGLSSLMSRHVDAAWSEFGMHGHGVHGGVQHPNWRGTEDCDDAIDTYRIGFEFHGKEPAPEHVRAWHQAVAPFLIAMDLSLDPDCDGVPQIL